MTEEEASKFTTKRRSIGENNELKWGGEDGEPWSNSIETSENITVADDGTITSKSDDNTVYSEGDGEDNWAVGDTRGSYEISVEIDHLLFGLGRKVGRRGMQRG